MLKEPRKCSHLTIKKFKIQRIKPFFQKLKKNLMKKWMMWNKWTKWFCIQKLWQLETNNFKRTKDWSKSGLMNKRNLIWWWRLRDWKFFKKRRREKIENIKLESKALKLLLIRFKRELFKEWKNKKLEIKRESNFLKTLRRWDMRTWQQLK